MVTVVEMPFQWSMAWGLVLGVVFLWWAVRVLDWAWLKPKRLGRELRAQGLRGTEYRFFYGDLTENARLNKEAQSEAMPLSHDIIPRVAPLFHRAMEENGKICITWHGPNPRVTISDPALVREVLANKFGHFEKPVINPLTRLFATGLASCEGEKWARHRRILNPAFHHEKLKRMLPAFATCCSELISRWQKSVGFDGSFELDVWPELLNLTGDVISRTAFGSSYAEGRRIFQLQQEQVELAVQALQTLYIPGYRFLPTKNNRRMKEINREVGALVKGIIGKREKAIKMREASSNDDLLGFLMESNLKHSQENNDASNAKMTTEEVIEECKLFYFAGQETTAVLLTWTMVALSMHPTWQDKARREVLQVFGNDCPSLSDGLSRLKIVTMILYEVLRLYPPATVLVRKTFKRMELGGITYPPGVMLSLPIIFIHHDPDVWGKDAGEFNPARFAEGISKATVDGQVAFFPFGWGPRTCIGQSFALLEAKMALTMILYNFSFQLAPSYAHAPYLVATLHPQYGAQIKLQSL
ncbi:cytochrome P450 CYP72A616-like [Typha angustifolia]|uniref:cytochrome P450 CYP72A616-like n=1 Tax=Typha angustifolia TaxID=59011 RepID=UPI003C2C4F05